MGKIVNYLNPLARLGVRRYSIAFPLLFTLFVYSVSEVYSNVIVQDPRIVGVYIILVSIGLIIFFAFRDGILGGYISVVVTICYYLYIILTRYSGTDSFTPAIQTTILVSFLFFVIAFIIGWLKEKIDILIEREADEKRRLLTIIRQLPVGVLITDAHGTVVEVNPKVKELLDTEVPPGITIPTLKSRKSSDASSKSIVQSPIHQVLTHNQSVIGQEYVVDHSDGSHLHLQVSASPIHNNKGQVIAKAMIINDITQQKEIEELKDEFIEIASHELKTPLTTIKGYTQILERLIDKNGTNKASSYLRKTNKYVERLATLIEDLLDVSKIQAGKIEFHYEEYDFDKMIEETIHSLREFNTTYKIQKKGKLKQPVYGDSARTEQVVTNLLSNAMKYSPDNKKVLVTVAREGDMVEVSVQDFGIGIPVEKQKEIFSRFYRVESTAEKFSGLGIGLYISAEIIHRQGGEIWVKSKEGQGSTFYFTLPIRAKEEQ